MKKIKKRSYFALALIGIAAICLVYFIVLLAINGADWASARFNPAIYLRGVLTVGTLTDREGAMLSTVDEHRNRIFADDSEIRRSTLHAVGDLEGNIGTGALAAFSAELIGYNFITGIYSRDGTGRTVQMTIDSALNAEALRALDGRRGAVMVMNYQTGEILSMVSSPTFDPSAMPADVRYNPAYDGVFINRAISSTFTPGSVFKLITAAAAIENVRDVFSREFVCEGVWEVGGGTVTCTREHGRISFEEAMTVSCNIAFGELALELGADTLGSYVDDLGFTQRTSVDGIMSASGSFHRALEGSTNLAWSGAGQHRTTVCPVTMLRFVGAVANDGLAVDMRLINRNPLFNFLPIGYERIMSSTTAQDLAMMIDYSIQQSTAVNDSFPGLQIHAKTGTAEVGGGLTPHAWFAGYIANEGHPYAFVVMVENGGGGFAVASPIANRVLQAAVN